MSIDIDKTSSLKQFEYLLNGFENAAQCENPADADYAGHRKKLFAYVSAALEAQERYEVVRRLNVPQFQALFVRALRSTFDKEVDSLRQASKQT